MSALHLNKSTPGTHPSAPDHLSSLQSKNKTLLSMENKHTKSLSSLSKKKKKLVILPSLVTLTHILSKMQANSFHGNFLQFNREKIKHCHGFF